MTDEMSPYGVLFVTPDAPDIIVEAAYKVLTKIYNPNGESTKKLNEAWEQIQKERSL